MANAAHTPARALSQPLKGPLGFWSNQKAHMSVNRKASPADLGRHCALKSYREASVRELSPRLVCAAGEFVPLLSFKNIPFHEKCRSGQRIVDEQKGDTLKHQPPLHA
eukprot:353248-Chlamydomonas_euryale.AAC.6